MPLNPEDDQDPTKPADKTPEPDNNAATSKRKTTPRSATADLRIKSLMESLQNLAGDESAEGGSNAAPTDAGASSSEAESTPSSETQPRDAAEPVAETLEPGEESQPEGTESAAEPASQPERSSSEQALADVRRSLIEEQSVEKTGFQAAVSRLGSRLFGRKRKGSDQEGSAEARLADEFQIPETPAPRKDFVRPEPTTNLHADLQLADAAPAQDHEAPAEQLENELPDPLDLSLEKYRHEPGARTDSDTETQQAEQPAAPAQSILAGLRQAGQSVEEDQDESGLRQAALEDYVTEPEAPEETGTTAVTHRLRRSWRDMRRVDRQMLVGALTILALAVVGGIAYALVKTAPPPTIIATPTLSPLPFPISVSLPGNIVFPLGTGFVQNGKWNPAGPEWLQGTEICRWISLPWTVQLEAILRTMKPDDEIKISMSNYDNLVYKVKSIEQVPSGDITKLAPSTPSLLLILSKQDSDSRWVVTAMP